MDAVFLIAALNWNLLLYLGEAILALGAVIFVHELGHFAVAKLCGVKVEKFYLGFDAYGLRFCRFRRGETEYGIGIIPLGGYVKMLGQEDNPARLTEEIERAKLSGDSDAVASAAAASAALYDPRSYLAKSVPQRMAIISAGVIMNLIFAFLAAMGAYRLGVKETPCIVSRLFPGEAAWRADLRPGDHIVRVGHRPDPQFRDLQASVTLGNLAQGVRFEVRREGTAEPFPIVVQPKRTGPAPRIGILGPSTMTLRAEKPAATGSPAAAAKPPIAAGDQVVAVNGAPVADFAQWTAALARAPGEPLTVKVRRSAEGSTSAAKAKAPADAAPVEVDIQVSANPLRTFGLTMRFGPITAVQANSPAAQADLREGDTLLTLDGQPIGDPQTLPERLRRLAPRSVTLTFSRAGQAEPQSATVTLRDAPWFEEPFDAGQPFSAPALGIAYQAQAVVASVEADSPAAQAGLAAGDRMVRAKLLPAEKPSDTTETTTPQELEIEFSESEPNWAFFMAALQLLPAESRYEIERADGKKFTLTPSLSDEWFNPERGFMFQGLTEVRRASTLGESVRYARREMVDSILQVYRVIHKIFSGQISPKVLGGPFTIAATAGMAAQQGIPELLLFLTLLSANLAVVNFLPIPLLDGGHMVFLLWEGIRGKPASEKVILTFHYGGFCFIMGLMIWVLFLDLERVGRWLGG